MHPRRARFLQCGQLQKLLFLSGGGVSSFEILSGEGATLMTSWTPSDGQFCGGIFGTYFPDRKQRHEEVAMLKSAVRPRRIAVFLGRRGDCTKLGLTVYIIELPSSSRCVLLQRSILT